MLAQHLVWRFNNDRETKVPQRFVVFVESGIYQHVKLLYQKWMQFGLRRSFSRQNSKEARVTPLKLSSSLRTLFYLYAIFVAVALSIILLETLWTKKYLIYLEIKARIVNFVAVLK